MTSDPAPRGGIPGPCSSNWLLVPFQTKIVPPKRGLYPEEINRLGASGAQIEAQISVFCALTPDFATFLGWRPFFFFLEITCFGPEKPLEFPISVGKSLEITVKTFFFFEFTCFRPEKPLEFPISAGKSLAIFALHLVHLIQSGINFSCPPKIYFCPPSHAILRRACMTWCKPLSWPKLSRNIICMLFAISIVEEWSKQLLKNIFRLNVICIWDIGFLFRF